MAVEGLICTCTACLQVVYRTLNFNTTMAWFDLPLIIIIW